MKNAKLGKVEIRSSRLPISRNNLSRDVHTTASFCDFQPTMVHEMVSDSSFTMNIETGVLMGSMVCPTMGRLNLESFGMFVPTTDIFPCYNEFKTGTPYTYGANTFVPLHRPRVPVCILAMMCLFGARATLYYQYSDNGKSQIWHCGDTGETAALIAKIKTSYGSGNFSFLDLATFGGFNNESMRSLNPIYIFRSLGLRLASTAWTNWLSTNFAIPLAGSPLSSVSSGFLFSRDNNDADSFEKYGTKFVSIEKPDFQINIPYKSSADLSSNDSLACLCFKMSDFGRRIYRLLRGCGIKPNFNDASNVDVSPLMAVWKAYYDMFGIKKWSNYQSTSLNKMISLWLSKSCPATLVSDGDSITVLLDFMMDLGRMWFTDEQDFITAHQANIEDDPTNPISASGFIDVGSTLGSIGTVSDVLQAVGTKPVENGFENKHAAINRVLHSQVDSELLRKFYLWTNRNSIIGQDVAELLKAQGHEKWLSEHQSRFIGHHSIRLNIDKVISQSDTYDSVSGEGALLGEYGGRGLGYDDNSIMSYRTNEHGMFIVLTAAIPNAGFCQGNDLRWRRDTRMQEYQPEFDGVGMEASSKEIIFGGDIRQPSLTDVANDYDGFKWHNKTFGFVPMYSRYKYLQNLMNGEFEFGSSQLDKLCYTLDRILTPNDAYVRLLENDVTHDSYDVEYGGLDAVNTPVAGVVWRYLGRYAWLANFRRIFAVRGNADEVGVIRWLGGATPFLTEFSVAGPDDFIIHQVQNNKYYAHMLSLEASYETKQDGNSGSFDMKSAKV